MVSICFYDLVHDKLTMKHIFEQCVLMKKAVPVRILKYLCCFHQCYQRWVRPFELITIDIESQDCILFYFYMNIFPYVYRQLKVILMTQPQLRAATNLSPADLPPNIYWHPAILAPANLPPYPRHSFGNNIGTLTETHFWHPWSSIVLAPVCSKHSFGTHTYDTGLAPAPMKQFWHPYLWHSFGTRIYDTVLASAPLTQFWHPRLIVCKSTRFLFTNNLIFT